MNLGRQESVHRLVAEAFIHNPKDKAQVNHINGNSLDNIVENLEWATPKENTRHAHKIGLVTPRVGKLNPNSKKVINTETKEVFESIGQAAESGGVNLYTLSNYLNGKRTNKTNFKFLQND